MLLPTQKGGTPDIPDEVYAAVKEKWLRDAQSDTGYSNLAFTQGTKQNRA